MKLSFNILLLMFIVLSSCQKRDWNNPFDPECPKEIWTPTNFKAVQEGSTIKLMWSQPVNSITGFKIVKKIDSGQETNLSDQSKDNKYYIDATLTGGKVHVYSLVAYAGSNLSNTVTVQITPILPVTLSTATPSSITVSSAILGGTITSDGGAAITERGVCWATTTNPTTSNSKLAIGNGTGIFSNTITGLTANTTYYGRSYAINSQGTAYGNEINFKTSIVLSLATLTTSTPTSITSTSATLGGIVTSDGNATVTERGVVYATTQNPTTANTKVANGTGTGSFTSNVTGLTAGTTYYVRAYAINSQGTAYGSQQTFTCSLTLSLATVTTTLATNITNGGATLGGNVTSDGNATVTERGICYSTSTNPTTSSTKIAIGNGTGSFSSNVTVLTSGTNYYVRAYAINSQGTAYGSEVSFKTSQTLALATVTTTSVATFTSTTAVLGGNVTSDGNATVTERGICYSTSPNPTTSNTKVAIGSGTGSFSQAITGLTANTTYYVRAYAVNSIGTNYGNEVNFSTNAELNTVTDIDGNVYHTVTIGTQVWMVENLKTTKYNDGTPIPNVTVDATWSALTTGAYCWHNNDGASYKNTFGALYNWYAVNTSKLAPKGWHVPTDNEWTTLTDYLGGKSIAGGKMKEEGTLHWLSPNVGATNESGFTAISGVTRGGSGMFTEFSYYRYYGYWWSSSEDGTTAWIRNLNYNMSDVSRVKFYKEYGSSVRCLKN